MMSSKSESPGWTPLFLLVCIGTTLGAALPVGYFLGVMNTLAAPLKIWCTEVLWLRYETVLSATELQYLWSGAISAFLIGGMSGSLATAWCCDRFGRRGTLLLSASLFTCAAFLLQFCRRAQSIEMLFIGRYVAGLAAALIYSVHPMYLVELASPKLRSSVGALTPFGVTAGIFVGQIFSLRQVFGTSEQWQYALSFFIVFVWLGFLPVYWFPESPRWLYAIRRDEAKARAELLRLRHGAKDCVENEVHEMQVAASVSTGKRSVASVLCDRKLLMPLILVLSYGLSQQLSGINAVIMLANAYPLYLSKIFYYSVSIYTKAGFTPENAAWMNLGAGFLNVCVNMLGPQIMAKCNRRPLIMSSAAGCGIAQFSLVFVLFYIDNAAWLPIFSIFLVGMFITFFGIGLGPCPYIIGVELFEVATRPVAMSITSLSSWFGNCMIGMFFPALENAWGSFAFMTCGVVCVYCFVITLVGLPETRPGRAGKTHLVKEAAIEQKAVNTF